MKERDEMISSVNKSIHTNQIDIFITNTIEYETINKQTIKIQKERNLKVENRIVKNETVSDLKNKIDTIRKSTISNRSKFSRLSDLGISTSDIVRIMNLPDTIRSGGIVSYSQVYIGIATRSDIPKSDRKYLSSNGSNGSKKNHTVWNCTDPNCMNPNCIDPINQTIGNQKSKHSVFTCTDTNCTEPECNDSNVLI